MVDFSTAVRFFAGLFVFCQGGRFFHLRVADFFACACTWRMVMCKIFQRVTSLNFDCSMSWSSAGVHFTVVVWSRVGDLPVSPTLRTVPVAAHGTIHYKINPDGFSRCIWNDQVSEASTDSLNLIRARNVQ